MNYSKSQTCYDVNYEDEPFYCSPAYNPEDIVCPGSDTEESVEEVQRKRLRYEEQAKRYFEGHLPVLLSATLKGPLSKATGWVNPWPYRPRKKHNEDWWQPGSEDMLFTRENVMRRAADHGLGYLNPTEALAWCKASAQAEAEALNGIEALEGVIETVEQKHWDEEEHKSEDSFVGGTLEDTSARPKRTRYTPESDVSMINNYRASPCTRISMDGDEKRRIDIPWLKGSYISKWGRREGLDTTTPTPLREITSERARGQNRILMSELGARSRQLSSSNAISCPDPEQNNAVLRQSSKGQSKPTSTLSPRQTQNPDRSQSRHYIKKVSGVLEAGVSTPLDGDIDERYREMDVPILSNISPLSRNRTPNLPLSTPVIVDLLGSEKSQYMEETSFVSYVAPSSRDLETFRFRKKRRTKYLSREEGTDALPDFNGHLQLHSSRISPGEEEFDGHNINSIPHIGAEPGNANRVSFEIETSKIEPKSSKRELSDNSWDMVDDFNLEPSLRHQLDRPGTEAPILGSQISSHRADPNPIQLYSTPSKTTNSHYSKFSHSSQHMPKMLAVSPIPVNLSERATISHPSITSSSHNNSVATFLKNSTDRQGSTPYSKDASDILYHSPNGIRHSSRQTQKEATRMAHDDDIIRKKPSQNNVRTTEMVKHTRSALVPAKTGTRETSSDASWEGCEPQTPWGVGHLELLHASSKSSKLGEDRHMHQVEEIRRCSTQEGDSSVQGEDEQGIHLQQSEMPSTPEDFGIKPFRELMTPTPHFQIKRSPLDKLPSTQLFVDAATENPWTTNLNKRSSARSQKRVSFGLPLTTGRQGSQADDVERGVARSRLGSPLPNPVSDGIDSEDIFHHNTSHVKKFEKHFIAARKFKRILPEISSRNGSPALAGQAEAFIAADREASTEELAPPPCNETRSGPLHETGISGAWNARLEEDVSSLDPFSHIHKGEENEVVNGMAKFDMEDALDEVGNFLEDWSVEAELKKARESESTTPNEGRGFKRRSLFGIV